METAMKESTTFQLNAEQVANETTLRAIREAMDMQNAYKSGTLAAKPIDLSSVDNMLLCEALDEVKAHMAGELELPEAKDLLSTAELQSIRQGMDDIRHGRTHRMKEGESLSDFIDRTAECTK